MVAASRHKTPDKQEVCRKVTTLLKKVYAGTVPKRELPVLETLLYAICLENTPMAQADSVYAKLLNAFHDLNEVRVSSITELLPVFSDVDEAEWRALRVKSTLQFIFETNYAFDFESLKRKTADLAVKQLAKISALSYFVRSYVLQHCLGSHVLPIDNRMHAALVFLGLAEAGATTEHVAEALRSSVRKADAPQFCHLLHCVATDSKRMRAFASAMTKPPDPSEDAVSRLDLLLRRGDVGGGAKARPAKPAVSKAATKGSGAKAAASKGAGKNGAASRTPGRVGTKKRH